MSSETANPTIVEGSIWERDDELFLVERVYDAHRAPQASEGTTSGLIPVTLVKIRCIDPMPRHCERAGFLEKYQPYDPERV